MLKIGLDLCTQNKIKILEMSEQINDFQIKVNAKLCFKSNGKRSNHLEILPEENFTQLHLVFNNH